MGRLAQCRGRTALDRDLFELAIGEESNPLAIRRKEWRISAFRAGEWGKLALIDLIEPARD
jgi:hypothetical protein